MDLNMIRNHKPKICDDGVSKESSVLIPIVNYNGQNSILFQVRSESLLKQPSEICFPGGRIESDETPIQAAVRETCEELLIKEDNLKVLGELDTLVTPFNTIIYPFAAYLYDYQNTYSKFEVQEVFYIPIEFLKDYEPKCSNLSVNMEPCGDFPFEKVQGGMDYPWAKGIYPVYFYEYKGKIIWGITARILKNFIELLKQQ
ncbi:MAG: hydrolase [Clostridia bacterium]|jgi:8-oxo-dGTP pyrophosphatase MutT (NUDIX family)|nr:hydrolase [Clostridia bacterium]